MEELHIEENQQYYPPVPKETPRKQSSQRSIISLLIFIIAFYLFFQWDMFYILVLVGILMIHELGHYLAMRAFNYKDLSIFFIPLIGAAASGTKSRASQKEEAIIILAGPIPGIIIGTICFYYGMTMENHLLSRIANIFLFLNIFNLLPVVPLDGGRVLKTLFFESNHIISQVFLIISMIVLTAFAIYAESYFFLVIPFFLYLQLTSGIQTRKLQKALKQKGMPFNKHFDELSPEEYWKTRDELPRYIKFFTRLIIPGRHIMSPNENRIINQIKALIQKPAEKDLSLLGKLLVMLVWISGFVLPVLIALLIFLNSEESIGVGL